MSSTSLHEKGSLFVLPDMAQVPLKASCPEFPAPSKPMHNTATGCSCHCAVIPGTGIQRRFTRTEKAECSLDRSLVSKVRDMQEATAVTGSGWDEISTFTGHLAALEAR